MRTREFNFHLTSMLTLLSIMAAFGLSFIACEGAHAASGYIVSVVPSPFNGIAGQTGRVTVTVKNTSSTQDFLILHPSSPSGWSVSALDDRNIYGDCNPTIDAGATYAGRFDITPPASGGSGTILWTFNEDGLLSNLKLDRVSQSVSATVPESVSTQAHRLTFGWSNGQQHILFNRRSYEQSWTWRAVPF